MFKLVSFLTFPSLLWDNVPICIPTNVGSIVTVRVISAVPRAGVPFASVPMISHLKKVIHEEETI